MRKFAEQFEKAVGSSPIVLSSHIEKHFGPSGETLYLRGSLRFIDSSMLEIAILPLKTHTESPLINTGFNTWAAMAE